MLWQGEISLWKFHETHAAILSVLQQRIIEKFLLKGLLY